MLAGSRNNNIIAESDYVAALAAIQNAFDPDCPFQQTCAASFSQHIQSMVQPVCDDAFFLYKRQTRTSGNQQSVREERIESDVSTIPHRALRLDEEELLDHEALSRAKELRAKVRAEVARLQLFRESVLAQAKELATLQYSKLSECQCRTDNDTEENTSTQIMQQKQALQQKLDEMQHNVEQMQHKLHATQDQLPTALSHLQETILAIEESKTISFSQTEQAIRSRVLEEEEDVLGDSTSPEEKLANYLS